MATTLAPPVYAGRRYTFDEIRPLVETCDWRIELLDGHLLVSPPGTSWHQTLCWRLSTALGMYAVPRRLGRPFSPGYIVYPPGVEFQPDVLVTPWAVQLLPWREMTEWLLAVEVLSHTTREVDLGSKRSCYMDLGVQELWLVDPDIRRVTVVRRDAEDVHFEAPALLTWHPSRAFPPLTIDLTTLFADN